MKLLTGKWFVALRFKNDLCIGLGKASQEMKAQAVRTRPHRGI